MMSNSSTASRFVQPAILTAFALGLALVFAFVFSWPYVVLYLGVLPVPLLVLWQANQVQHPAARIAAAQAHAHA